MDDLGKGYGIALRFIANRMKTEDEVRKKLKTWYGDMEVDSIVKKLKESGYIDDGNYTECYIRDRMRFNPMGRMRIKRELEQRGIDKKIIEDSHEYNAIDEMEIMEDILNAKFSRYNPRDDGDIRKITGYFYRRGFNFENINHVLGRYRKGLRP